MSTRTYWPKARRWLRFHTHRAWHTLTRTPYTGPRVLSNSVPKAGSHLLLRCLELMPGLIYTRAHLDWHMPLDAVRAALDDVRPGEFATAHLPYTPEVDRLLQQRQMRHLLIIRDPRDIVVSHVHWVTYRYTQGRFHPYFRSLPDDAARLMASIQGTPTLPQGDRLEDIGTRVRAYLAWVERGALLVRFEDLVGPAGGGTREAQHTTIRRIADYLGLPLSDAQVRAIAARLYNRRAPTFRRGHIGDWRNHFSEAHKAAFKAVAGDLLIALGYEKNDNW